MTDTNLDRSRYEQNHPTWVLYQCDGKTPAWEFGQERPGSVPVDIFNPEVLAWQLQFIDDENTEIGKWMDAIAWDNFGLVRATTVLGDTCRQGRRADMRSCGCAEQRTRVRGERRIRCEKTKAPSCHSSSSIENKR